MKNKLALGIAASALFIYGCGSERDSDQTLPTDPKIIPSPTAGPKASVSPTPAVGRDTKGDSTANACASLARLMTKFDPSQSAPPVQNLTGRVDPTCVQSKIGYLLFSSTRPLSLQGVENCTFTDGDFKIKCLLKVQDVMDKGVFSIPVVLDPTQDYRDLKARIEFR